MPDRGFDARLIERVFSRYPAEYRPSRIESPDDAAGFSGAATIRVQCAAGAFCLRGWPPDSLPPARIRGLHRLLATVFAAGVRQAAVPVRTRDGDTLVDDGSRYWHLEPWMPGRADFHAHPSEARLRETMRCLAAWHRAAAAFQPVGDERAWFFQSESAPSPAVGERLQLIAEWVGGRADRVRGAMARAMPSDRLSGKGDKHPTFCDHSQAEPQHPEASPLFRTDSEFRDVGEAILERFSREAAGVAAQLQAAARLRFRLQPCLRDIWHDHVLFEGDRISGLIDPSACRSENVAADLARLLGSLLRDDRRGWQTALDEYHRHRPLTLDELGLVEILDRSGVLLSGLTWLDRYFLQRQTFARPDLVLERMRTIRDRMERLSIGLPGFGPGC